MENLKDLIGLGEIDINFIDMNQGGWFYFKRSASKLLGENNIVFTQNEPIPGIKNITINIIRKELKLELVEENNRLYIMEVPEKGFSKEQSKVLLRLQHDKKVKIAGVSLLSKGFFDVPKNSPYKNSLNLELLKKETSKVLLDNSFSIFLPEQFVNKNFEWIKEEIFKWGITHIMSVQLNKKHIALERNQYNLINEVKSIKNKRGSILYFINRFTLEGEIKNYFYDKEKIKKTKEKLDKITEEIIGNRKSKIETLESDTRGLFNIREYKSGFGDSFVSKYYECIDSIKLFLDNKMAKSNNERLSYSARKLSEELFSNILVIPLIGIFSSGKTTLINAIIGEENAFKTAATHNTSILTILNYEKDKTKFRVEFQYKNEIDLILASQSFDKPTAFKANHEGRIKTVRKYDNYAEITLKSSNNQEISFYISLDPEHQLLDNIKPGIYIDDDTPLTTGLNEEIEERIIKNQEEGIYVEVERDAINAVVELIKTKVLYSVELSIWKREPKSRHFIEKTLNHARLSNQSKQIEYKYEIVFEKYKNVNEVSKRLEKFCKKLDKKKEPQIPINDFNGIYKILLKAKVNIDHRSLVKSHPLTDKSQWKWFQGENGFAEELKNVLVLDHADVYLDHELFKSVSLVDTPGLGSITDRHDETTEQFLRRGDAFIIMIELRKGVEHQETYKLLNFIQMILNEKYKNNAEIEKRLFFFLNWFNNRLNQNAAINHFNKFKKNLQEKYGWNTNRIYLCDLHKVLYKNDRREKIGKHPSISKFREDLKDYVDKNGVLQKMKDLIQDVDSILEREEKNNKVQLDNVKEKISISDKLDELLLELVKIRKNGKNEIKSCKDGLKRELNSMCKNFEENLEFLLEAFNKKNEREYNEYNGNLIRLIEEIYEKKEDIEGLLPSLMKGLKDKLENIKQKPIVEYDKKILKNKINSIPVISKRAFSKKVSEIKGNWPNFWGRLGGLFGGEGWHSYENESRNELVSWFENRVDKFRDEYIKTLEWVEEQWKEIVNQSYKQIKEFRDNMKSKDKDSIDFIKRNIQEVKMYKKEFRDLKKVLEKYYKEA